MTFIFSSSEIFELVGQLVCFLLPGVLIGAYVMYKIKIEKANLKENREWWNKYNERE